MTHLRQFIAGIVLLAVALFTIGVRMEWRSIFELPPLDTSQLMVTIPAAKDTDISEIYRQQRNQLSQILNKVKQELAVMSCEMKNVKQKLEKPSSLASVSGGWCKNASKPNGGEHMFDETLALALSYFFENKTVASFGDGPGDYKNFLDSSQRLRLYDAYDGAPYGPETSGGVVKFLDLTAPQYGLPLYDWVISMEVAEHIPAKYESVFVDNIVRHANSGIVLSWAVPGQGGFSHINNKPLSYVKSVMSKKGFEIDLRASQNLQSNAIYPWLRENLYVYNRDGSQAVPGNV